jgi:hypothetical protein
MDLEQGHLIAFDQGLNQQIAIHGLTLDGLNH